MSGRVIEPGTIVTTPCVECARPVIVAAHADGHPLVLEVAMRGALSEVCHVVGEPNPRFAAYHADEDPYREEPRFALHVCRR